MSKNSAKQLVEAVKDWASYIKNRSKAVTARKVRNTKERSSRS